MGKKRIIIAVVLLFTAAVAGGGIFYFVNRQQEPLEYVVHRSASYEKDGMDYYSEDYPQVYSEELGIIFGEGYKVGEKKSVYMEGEDCDCGICSTGYWYDTWEVTYHDQAGETFTQTIDNRYSLEYLELTWLKNHLAQYYEKKYIVKFFDEGTFEELSWNDHYCSVHIGIGVYNCPSNKEMYEKVSAGNGKYKRQLLASYKDPVTMIRLPEINYDEVYNQFPMETSFYFSIDDKELSGEEKAVHEKEIKSRALEMIDEILRDTEDTCNIRVDITSANGYEDLYDGTGEWNYYILQGKQIEFDGYDSFSRAHADLYKGILW